MMPAGWPTDQDEEAELDYSDVCCPRRSCGSVRIQVTKSVRPGRWYSAGEAVCRDCGCRFALQIIPDVDEA
jgi:hypothetical protein